jgi:hypothetical protein
VTLPLPRRIDPAPLPGESALRRYRRVVVAVLPILPILPILAPLGRVSRPPHAAT